MRSNPKTAFTITTLCLILASPFTTRAADSKPTQTNGLSSTVILKTPTFGADPQWPIFTVRFQNTTIADIALYDPVAYWNWKIRFTKKGERPTYLLRFGLIFERRLLTTPILKPRETLDVLVDLNQTPRPLNVIAERAAVTSASALPHLPPGPYELTVDIKLQDNPSDKAHHYWTGSLTTDPVDIQAQDTDAIYNAAIHRVTDKFDNFGLWTNGLFREIHLPATAKLPDVIAQAVKSVSQIKSYHVLDTRPIKLGQQWKPAYAALLDTSAGPKLLILHPFANSNSWWSRFYDTTLTPATQPATQATLKHT